MGLLAPLYIAGLAALSLPLVLHLIRRTPRGRQAFSSLMFLTPSPPRLTRRSRLDHVLLLLMRLAALALLAVAFARPFLRETAMLPLDNLGSRRVAILLDTSASMRRGDLWQQAVAKAAEVLKDIGPKDDVALFAFDDRLHPIVEFAHDASEPTAGKPDLVRQRLKELAPSWRSTDLAGALVAVAGELEAADEERRLASQPQLVLIADLARGSRLDALEAYKWPDNMRVVVHPLLAKGPTNAAVHLLADDEQAGEPRVRVTNAANSTGDQFSINWQPANEAAASRGGQPLATYVPPGQSRVIRLPRPAGEAVADRVVLKGDDTEFDNTYYAVPPLAQQIRVDWIGDEPADDAASPRYYFELAVADDARRKIEVATRGADETWTEAAVRPGLVVVTSAVSTESRDSLGAYANEGGTVLVLLKQASVLRSLASLLDDVVSAGSEVVGGSEPASGSAAGADRRTYSLLGEIDFTHPLFAAFADPRYSGFTKIHFWRHRAVTVQEPAATRILARFDNGDPAILEREMGAGRIVAFASGWQPDESQLALSSKFVPLIHAILDLACGGPSRTANLLVGQSVHLPVRSRSQSAVIEKPDGTRVTVGADAKVFDGADQPGIFRLHVGENEYPFAVNLEPAESNTAPLELERLEQLGVRFSSQLTRAERADKLRQQRDTELESHQQLWRWLLVGALGLLIVETWFAGRAAGRLQASVVGRPSEVATVT
ncbi:MAG TPA: BatA domain-containing protein [Pirellulales bacterium]|nr:BatA domain-containing protein [Pirellulales bacterium]